MSDVLKLLPDKSVNAKVGDPLDVWDGENWVGGYTYHDVHHCVVVMTHPVLRYPYASPEFIRHAGGTQRRDEVAENKS